MHKHGGIMQIHTAVYLYQNLVASLINHASEFPYLVEAARNEGLPAVAGVDRHQQNHINIWKNILYENHR